MNNFYNTILGQNVKAIRQARYMSQRELSNFLGKTKVCISRIENGKGTTTKTMFDIANALDVSPLDLLSINLQISTEIKGDYK